MTVEPKIIPGEPFFLLSTKLGTINANGLRVKVIKNEINEAIAFKIEDTVYLYTIPDLAADAIQRHKDAKALKEVGLP